VKEIIQDFFVDQQPSKFSFLVADNLPDFACMEKTFRQIIAPVATR